MKSLTAKTILLAAGAQEVSASVEELSATARRNTENALQTAGIASETARAAAEEIRGISADTQKQSDRALESLGRLVPAIRRTSTLVEDIGAASREQEIGTEQISKAVLALDEVVQKNAAAAEELAASAASLSEESVRLEKAVSSFKTEDRAPALPGTEDQV